jgi:predicted transcriptional regulator
MLSAIKDQSFTIILMKKPSAASPHSETRVLTAHIPSTLAEKVDQLAERMERSRGWIVKQALLAWVEEEEQRHRMTVEALADVDAGKVLEHHSIHAWAESLGTTKPLRPPAR